MDCLLVCISGAVAGGILLCTRSGSHANHPTAETIYGALSPKYPTLSRTTVYQTLERMYENGLAQKIVIEDGQMLRFLR
jgi:Fe2+ or Zn2+ uptake regulation protein